MTDLAENLQSLVDGHLETVRTEASDYLREHPGHLQLFMHGDFEDGRLVKRRVLSVRPPNGMLLALEEILLPPTLQNAANLFLQKAGGKTLPGKVETVDPEYKFKRVKALLDEILLIDAKFDDFAPSPVDPCGVDQWLLIQFCLGRLEPILPEHLAKYAQGPLSDEAAGTTTLPSERIREIIPGCSFPGTVTAYCLDQAFLIHRGYYEDFRQNLGLWKQDQMQTGTNQDSNKVM